MERQTIIPLRTSRIVSAMHKSYDVGGYTSNVIFNTNVPGKKEVIQIITVPSKDPELTNRVLSQLQLLLMLDTSDMSIMGHYLSFLALMFGNDGKQLVKEVENSGYIVTYVPYSDDRDFDDIDLLDERASRYLLVRLGQYCLLPFKHLTTANFDKFITSRTRALCAKMGVAEEPVGPPCILPAANVIKLRFGAMSGFKKQLIRVLQSQEFSNATNTGGMANYVLSILEYTDMTAYNFILNILVRTKSPVIFCQSIAMEVDNFLEAMEVVTKSPQPTFFAIFCHPAQLSIVQRSRFPILFATAIAVAGEMYTPIKRIVGVSNISSSHVEQLAELHNINTGTNVYSMQSKMMKLLPKTVDYRLFEERTNKQLLNMDSTNLGDVLKLKQDYGPKIAAGQNLLQDGTEEVGV